MIEGAVMNCTEAETVFSFICSALVLNWDNVSGIKQVQLDVACGATGTIGSENILSKTCVPHLPLNLS